MVLTTTGSYGEDTEADVSREMNQKGLGSEAPAKAKSVSQMSANSIKKKGYSTNSGMKGGK